MLFVLLVYLLKNVTRLCVFPGSFSYWRRNVETHYAKMMARRCTNRFRDLTSIIESIIYAKGYVGISADDTLPIKRTLIQFITIFNELGYKNSLSKDQHVNSNMDVRRC